MYYVKAAAKRRGKVIDVSIEGFLANTCLQANITKWYPGDGIVYFVDPEEAQVFIEESMRPGTDIMHCLQMLVPWWGRIPILDPHHDKVTIYVNNAQVCSVTVEEAPRLQDARHMVIRLVGMEEEPFIACGIVPEGTLFPMIYTKAFGPASLEECSDWVARHCKPLPDAEEVLVSGSGS